MQSLNVPERDSRFGLLTESANCSRAAKIFTSGKNEQEKLANSYGDLSSVSTLRYPL